MLTKITERAISFCIKYMLRPYGTATTLKVKEYGDPSKVLYLEDTQLPNLQENQVLVKFLASPINPADINTIQGVYAVKPSFPFVPGNEAVMEVVRKGIHVTKLGIGDRVLPLLNAMGTWRTKGVFNQDDLIKIPSDIGIIPSATLGINPCTAFRMLHDFVSLKKGDVIAQNAANSAVGLAVIQIAKYLGVYTINIIRDRPNFHEVKKYMEDLGADLVLTEKDLRTNKQLKSIQKPILALNGTCGKTATEMMRLMQSGSTMVTYGGMSRQPLTVPVSSLIFNDLVFKGYWMTRWSKFHGNDLDRLTMLDSLINLIRKDKLKPPPHDEVPFKDYKTAVENALPRDGMVGRKQILVFD